MNTREILSGRRVLLVEDESLVSMFAEDLLIDQGCVVILAMTLAAALEAAQTNKLDAAILDLNLGFCDTSLPVAQFLSESEIPFFFTTGYGSVGGDFAARPFLAKPYDGKQMIACLATLVSQPQK